MKSLFISILLCIAGMAFSIDLNGNWIETNDGNLGDMYFVFKDDSNGQMFVFYDNDDGVQTAEYFTYFISNGNIYITTEKLYTFERGVTTPLSTVEKSDTKKYEVYTVTNEHGKIMFLGGTYFMKVD